METSVASENIVYCHGLPGSAQEISFLNSESTKCLEVLGPQHIVDFMDAESAKAVADLHIIGFSLGCLAAVKLAEQGGDSVRKLSLISAATPLELGDFLPAMAGKVVFETAMRSAFRFRMLTAIQGAGVYLSPKVEAGIFRL